MTRAEQIRCEWNKTTNPDKMLKHNRLIRIYFMISAGNRPDYFFPIFSATDGSVL